MNARQRRKLLRKWRRMTGCEDLTMGEAFEAEAELVEGTSMLRLRLLLKAGHSSLPRNRGLMHWVGYFSGEWPPESLAEVVEDAVTWVGFRRHHNL